MTRWLQMPAVPAATPDLDERTIEALTGAAAHLSGAIVAAMAERLPWYGALSAEHRSWIGIIAHNSVTAFTGWLRHPGSPPQPGGEVFAGVPVSLIRAVSLEQTVAAVRVVVDVIEQCVEALVPAADAVAVRTAVLTYSRDIAFLTAAAYARTAEARGAWDARIEALVIDAVARDDIDATALGQAAALGWRDGQGCCVIVGRPAGADAADWTVHVAALARRGDLSVVAGMHAETAVIVLGGVADPARTARLLAPRLTGGPVVFGPRVRGLAASGMSARAAIAGLRAVAGWPGAPRPVSAESLLPERALLGDAMAQADLADLGRRISAHPVLAETLQAYLDNGGALEATGRVIIAHANTVRYRLRRITTLFGYAPEDPRDAVLLRTALTLSRLHRG